MTTILHNRSIRCIIQLNNYDSEGDQVIILALTFLHITLMNTVAFCSHQANSLHFHVASCLITWFCMHRKKEHGHTWHILRPNIINSCSASHNNWCTATLWNRIMIAQCEGMGEVGSARYEPALLPPCPSISVLSYSNCQRSTQSHQQSKG